jgi:hypothetical protein
MKIKRCGLISLHLVTVLPWQVSNQAKQSVFNNQDVRAARYVSDFQYVAFAQPLVENPELCSTRNHPPPRLLITVLYSPSGFRRISSLMGGDFNELIVDALDLKPYVPSHANTYKPRQVSKRSCFPIHDDHQRCSDSPLLQTFQLHHCRLFWPTQIMVCHVAEGSSSF